MWFAVQGDRWVVSPTSSETTDDVTAAWVFYDKQHATRLSDSYPADVYAVLLTEVRRLRDELARRPPPPQEKP